MNKITKADDVMWDFIPLRRASSNGHLQGIYFPRALPKSLAMVMIFNAMNTVN